MDILLIGLTVVLLLAAPKVWARYVFYKHSRSSHGLNCSGGELARQLLTRLRLNRVSLDQAQHRSHYDSRTRTLRLSAHTMHRCSMTAVGRAAFEVGHALQHHRDEGLLHYKEGLLRLARLGEVGGSGGLLLAPFLAPFTPAIAMLLLFCALVSMITGAAVHLVVLPIEWQAGFALAMPILEQHRPLNPAQRRAAREVMLACTCSRLAFALSDLLDGRHWLKAVGFKRKPRSD